MKLRNTVGDLVVAAAWLGSSGLCACTPAACKVDAPATEAVTVAPTPSPSRTDGLLSVEQGCTVGRLTANKPIHDIQPGGYCVDKVYYRGASVRIGRTNLFGVDADSDIIDKLVLLRAERRTNLARRIAKVGPCSDEQPFPVQFRGDWMADEGGYDNQLSNLAKASYLEALSQPTALSMLEVEQPSEPAKSERKSGSRPETVGQVKITVKNPFGQAFSGLELIVHYEGGPGKPMPHYETRRLDLKSGQRLDLQVPTAVERPVDRGNGETSWWKFTAVTLAGKAGGCTFLPSTYRR